MRIGMKSLILGITGIFGVIWGGAYLGCRLLPGDWRNAPLGITLSLVLMASILLAAFGAGSMIMAEESSNGKSD